MSGQRYVIKVLSGLYSDSELSLEEGRYTLGKAIDCDINIEDASLRDLEGTFVVSDSGVRFDFEGRDENAQYSVYYAAQPFDESSIDIEPYNVLYLNDFSFVVGHEGAEWPELDMERRPLAPQDDVNELGEVTDDLSLPDQDGDGLQEKGSGDLVGDETDFGALLDEGGEAGHGSSAVESVKPVKSNKILFVSALSLIVIGALSGGLYLSYESQQKQKKAEMAKLSTRSNMEFLQATIEKYNLKKLKIVQGNFTRFNPVIQGYVANLKQRTDLVSSLVANRARYDLDIYVEDHMLFAGRSLLDTFSFQGVELSIGRRPGTIVAKGYIENRDAWLKIKKELEKDVDGLKGLVDEVEDPSRRIGKLREIIEEVGLSKEVFLIPQGGVVFARTSLKGANLDKWRIIEETYRQTYENLPKLVTMVSKPNWVNIKSIVLGDDPYIITADGEKYVEGAIMRNGFRIDEISNEGVFLIGQRGDRHEGFRFGLPE